MTTKTNIVSSILIIFILTGCASYSIQTKNLVDQLKEKQKIAPNAYFQQFSVIDYPSNNLDRIKCQDKDGKYVWLYPDKNTGFEFITKSTGKKIKAYFDTVIFQNDTLFGLRSRLIGGLRAIPISDIDKITIYAEMPKVEPVTE
jgi:hypothetical protein